MGPFVVISRCVPRMAYGITNPLPASLTGKRYDALTHLHHHFVEMRPPGGGRLERRSARQRGVAATTQPTEGDGACLQRW